jgi:hypothetical protein
VGGMALASAVAFVWLGMVLAISFLEAPLKFRAPGITVPLGVGIGRIVFRALNTAEAVLAVLLLAGTLLARSGVGVGLAVALCAVLAAGALVLRPRMDLRVTAGRTADAMPRHSLHLWYIVLELVKVALLVAVGSVALAAAAAAG